MRFTLLPLAAFVTLSTTSLAAPTTLDFEDVPQKASPSSSYWLPFGESYVGHGFVLEDLNLYGTPPVQGVLFGYFAPGAYVPVFNAPAPFKSADTDGQSLMPQYSTAAIQLRAANGSAFTLTSLKLAGFYDRNGEFSNCSAGPATCTIELALSLVGGSIITHDLALDNYEGFEKWALNQPNVLNATLRQTTFNLAQGVGGWSYQLDDIVIDGPLDPIAYESLATNPHPGLLPEPSTLALLLAATFGLIAPRIRRAA